MAITANKIGIEKLTYNADAGLITFNGEDIIFANSSDAYTVERIITDTAKGTERRQGNKTNLIEFFHVGASQLSAVDADEGNINTMSIFQLGSNSADDTFDCNLVVVSERATVDPSGDQSGILYRAKLVQAV